MARNRRHRKSSASKPLKALPMEAVYAATLSLFSLIIYIAVIGVSAFMNGETPKLVGGIGMLGFIIALAALVYNFFQLNTKTEVKYRVICFGISTFATILWLAPYIYGLIK